VQMTVHSMVQATELGIKRNLIKFKTEIYLIKLLYAPVSEKMEGYGTTSSKKQNNKSLHSKI